MVEGSDRIKEIVRRFYEAVRGRYPVVGVFVYGSHAKGTARPDSDIEGEDHSRRVEITAELFHYVRQIDPVQEPKCIFRDEFEQPEPASILAEIIQTRRDVPLSEAG